MGGKKWGEGRRVGKFAPWRVWDQERFVSVFDVFFFFKKDEIIACLYVDGSDLVEGKTVMRKKERIINPYCLNRIWGLVWNFAM